MIAVQTQTQTIGQAPDLKHSAALKVPEQRLPPFKALLLKRWLLAKSEIIDLLDKR